MSKVYPQVGDLVKDCGTLGVITGIGEFRDGDGERSFGLFIDGPNGDKVKWAGFAGYAKTPKGNYKKKKGEMVSLHYHLIWNDKGYWEQTKGEGNCPLYDKWMKEKRKKEVK